MASRKKEERQQNRMRKIEAFLSLVGGNNNNTSSQQLDVCCNQDKKPSNKSEVFGKEGTNDGILPASPKKVQNLTREELVQLRARLAQHKKLKKLRSQFYLREPHFNLSSNTVTTTTTRPLSNAEFQQLVLFSFEGGCVYQKPSAWCVLNNWHRLSQSICIIVDGLTANEFLNAAEQHFPILTQEFLSLPDFAVKLVPPLPGALPMEEILFVPKSMIDFNKVQKRMYYDQLLRQTLSTLSSQQRSNSTSVEQNGLEVDDKVTKMALMLGAHAMIAERFPFSSHVMLNATTDIISACNGDTTTTVLRRRGVSAVLDILQPPPTAEELAKNKTTYVPTNDAYAAVSENSPLFAIDCEMCLTTARKNELTRVSLIAEDLTVVYDTYVKPHNKIVHYLTQYSGITPQHMKSCTVRLSDVQQKLRELLPENAILIGHSLNFDLHALNMSHPYVIDTSCIYNLTGCHTRKSKLQHLAQALLNKAIQCGNDDTVGHNSIEDAQTTMELVRLKLERNSRVFGDMRLGFQYEPIVTAAVADTLVVAETTNENGTELQVVETTTTTTTTVVAVSTTSETNVEKPKKRKVDNTIDAETPDKKVKTEPTITTTYAANKSTANSVKGWCTPITSHLAEHKVKSLILLHHDTFKQVEQDWTTTTTAATVPAANAAAAAENVKLQSYSNPKEAVKLAVTAATDATTAFLLVELHCRAAAAAATDGDINEEEQEAIIARRRKQLQKLDGRLGKILASAQDNALVTIVFQQRQQTPTAAATGTNSNNAEPYNLKDKFGLALCKVTNASVNKTAE